jgi:hypothetical protein
MSSIKGTLGIVCLSALVAAPMFAAQPNPISNAVKYKDAGAKPATGRSGSAAIQVRALRGVENTDIEVTTGQFDGAAPVGNLDKVQIKVFSTAGDVMITDNYRKGTLSGGYGHFTYSWPAPGTKIQVQANVSGIDPKRTDVVTVPATVQLRPDLTVAQINVAGQAMRGSVVNIGAVIREANGDMGARANCVLKADGVEIDRANNIWVDAGDAVSVEFRTVFETLGHKQLTVELTNVVPADYNDANNSASAGIEIVSPSSPLWYTFSASDINYDQTVPGHSHQVFESLNPSYPNWVRDSTSYETDTTHAVSYGASLQNEKAVQFPVALQSQLTVDGTPLLSVDGVVDENPNSFMNFSGDGYWNRCGDFSDGYQWMFVCHFHSEFDGVIRDLSTAFSSRNAGFVTYASTQTSTTRYATGVVEVFTYNYGGEYTTGDVLSPIPVSLGNNVNVHGAFTDAAGQHFEGDASVQLFPMEPLTYDYGDQCYPYDYTIENYGHIYGEGCAWPHSVATGRQGEAHGEIQY